MNEQVNKYIQRSGCDGPGTLSMGTPGRQRR